MPEDKKNKKPRRFRLSYLLLGLVVFLIIAFCFFRFHLFSLKEKKIQQIRDAGFPADCYELDKTYSIPEEAENAADYYIDAFAFLVPDNNNTRERRDIIERLLKNPDEPVPDDIKQFMEEHLTQNEKALELLHKAAEVEHCRYPIDLTNGFNTVIPHLAEVRSSVLLLRTEAIIHAENGEIDKAIDSIESAFAAADSLSLEPVYISFLVLNASKGNIFQGLERIMKRVDLTDTQLERLQKILNEHRDTASMTSALAAERCMIIELSESPVSDISGLLDGGPSTPYTLNNIRIIVNRLTGIEEMDILCYLDMMEEYINASQLPFPQSLKEFDKIKSRHKKVPVHYIISNDFFPSTSYLLLTNIKTFSNSSVLEISLTVMHYQKTKGILPANLTELVPEYVEAIPKDPFDGNDIRYKRYDSDFVVYSVGEDLVDNIASMNIFDVNSCGDDIYYYSE